MVDIWKKIFPSIYQSSNFSKIDPEKEGILDFCPICQELLPDKKIITFKKHEFEKHPKSVKETSKLVSQNVRILAIFGIILVGVVGFQFVVGMETDAYWEQRDVTWALADDCGLRSTEIELMIHESGFTSSSIDAINEYINSECYGEFSISNNLYYADSEEVYGVEEGTMGHAMKDFFTGILKIVFYGEGQKLKDSELTSDKFRYENRFAETMTPERAQEYEYEMLKERYDNLIEKRNNYKDIEGNMETMVN
jgi:hypothetical protein